MDESGMLAAYEATGCVLVPGFAADTAALSAWANEVPLVGQVTYEKGQVTRCEHFVHCHAGFGALTAGRMADVCGQLFGETTAAHLFKEKLNYKPPGGAGFMPHLDAPSLAFYAPREYDRFITVMLAIDPMTRANGCLRVSRGVWTPDNAAPCIPPDGDPEVGGRAGGLTSEAADELHFDDIECQPGDALFFHGLVPHRSASNTTAGYRRAVFFTYTPGSLPPYRTQYYAELQRIRDEWKQRLLDEKKNDYENDLAALATVPKVFDRSRYTVNASSCAPDQSDTELEMEVDALF